MSSFCFDVDRRFGIEPPVTSCRWLRLRALMLEKCGDTLIEDKDYCTVLRLKCAKWLPPYISKESVLICKIICTYIYVYIRIYIYIYNIYISIALVSMWRFHGVSITLTSYASMRFHECIHERSSIALGRIGTLLAGRRTWQSSVVQVKPAQTRYNRPQTMSQRPVDSAKSVCFTTIAAVNCLANFR